MLPFGGNIRMENIGGLPKELSVNGKHGQNAEDKWISDGHGEQVLSFSQLRSGESVYGSVAVPWLR